MENQKGAIIDYTNWLGRRKMRRIMPISVRFGTNKFHERPQWLLRAIDLETSKPIEKEFAMSDIHSWRTEP